MVFPSLAALYAMLVSCLTPPSLASLYAYLTPPSLAALYAYLTPPSLASLLTILSSVMGQTLSNIAWFLALPMVNLMTTTVRLCKLVFSLVEADPLWAIVVFVVLCVVSVLRKNYMYDKKNQVGALYMVLYADLEKSYKKCETCLGNTRASSIEIGAAYDMLMEGLSGLITHSSTLPANLWCFLVFLARLCVVGPISVYVWAGNVLYTLVWAVLDVACVWCSKAKKTQPAPAPAPAPVSGPAFRPFQEPLFRNQGFRVPGQSDQAPFQAGSPEAADFMAVLALYMQHRQATPV
jgi:hypothetical protein